MCVKILQIITVHGVTQTKKTHKNLPIRSHLRVCGVRIVSEGDQGNGKDR